MKSLTLRRYTTHYFNIRELIRLFFFSIVFFASLCLRFYSKSLAIMPLKKKNIPITTISLLVTFISYLSLSNLLKSPSSRVFFWQFSGFLKKKSKSSVVNVRVNFSHFSLVSVNK